MTPLLMEIGGKLKPRNKVLRQGGQLVPYAHGSAKAFRCTAKSGCNVQTPSIHPNTEKPMKAWHFHYAYRRCFYAFNEQIVVSRKQRV